MVSSLRSISHTHSRPTLWGRIDPIVDASLEPMVEFGNVPWGFVNNCSAALGLYGNAEGPADDVALALYEQFAFNVTRAFASRYGRDRVAGWQFRVGSEPNKPDHWKDSAAAYLRLYTAVDRAVRHVLGESAWVCPGNWARGDDFFVDYVLEHLSIERVTTISAGKIDDAAVDDADDVVDDADDRSWRSDDDDHDWRDEKDDDDHSWRKTHGHKSTRGDDDAARRLSSRDVWTNYSFAWVARTPQVLGMTYYAKAATGYSMDSFSRDAAWLRDLRGVVRGTADDAIGDAGSDDADDPLDGRPVTCAVLHACPVGGVLFTLGSR